MNLLPFAGPSDSASLSPPSAKPVLQDDDPQTNVTQCQADRAAVFSTWVGELLSAIDSTGVSEEVATPSGYPVPPQLALQASELASARGDLMFLDVRVQGQLHRALLDDGATSCFIDADLVATMGLQTVAVPPLRVALGDGSESSVNRAVHTELRLAKGVRYNALLYVLPLGPASVILGQPFYSDLRLKVDYGPAREVTFPRNAHRQCVKLTALPPPSPRARPVHLAVLSEKQMRRELRRGQQAGTPVSLAFIHVRVSTSNL
jgi:hypothetical protein